MTRRCCRLLPRYLYKFTTHRPFYYVVRCSYALSFYASCPFDIQYALFTSPLPCYASVHRCTYLRYSRVPVPYSYLLASHTQFLSYLLLLSCRAHPRCSPRLPRHHHFRSLRVQVELARSACQEQHKSRLFDPVLYGQIYYGALTRWCLGRRLSPVSLKRRARRASLRGSPPLGT